MIKNLSEKIGQEVKIKSWIDVARNQGKVAFFDFRDNSGKVQGVVFGKPEIEETAKKIRSEWVVEILAIVNQRPEKAVKEEVLNGNIELEIKDIKILSEAEIPFDLNEELNLDVFLDNQPYSLRSEKPKSVFKIQAEIVKSFRKTLNSLDFTEFQAPKIVGGDAEGGAEVYKIDYFGSEAGLATSPQLYKQIMVGIFERSFCVGNVFRAEKHSTSRHLNEYTSMDFEMGFIEDHNDVMNVFTKVMQGIKNDLEENCKEELKILETEKLEIPDKIPTYTLLEAQEILEKELNQENVIGEPDLEPEHEKLLSSYVKEKFNSDLLYVTHYPVSKRPFYAMEDSENRGFTKSFDAIFKGVEIVSGGQRRHNYENLLEGLKTKNLKPEDFEFYLQAFKTGLPPHGGIGFGLERVTQKIVGLDNVKKATLFPREINRIDRLINK